MRSGLGRLRCLILVLLLFCVVSGPAQAAALLGYVGPGAGLSMLGALFAVICVILLALLGPILFPIRMYLSWRRRRRLHRELKTDQL